MTAAKIWFFLMLLCGGLSAYFYVHPPDFNQPQQSYSPPPQTQSQPAPAPTVQVQAPPPQVLYYSKVMRRNDINYDVVLGKSNDWYDSGIPVIADQLVDITETDGLQSRFVVKFGDNVLFPGKLQYISEKWFLHFWTSHRTQLELPIDFFDTFKLKLLGDTPVCHLRITVEPQPNQDTCTFYMYRREPGCADYDALYAISLARYKQQQEQLPLQ